MSDGPRLVMMDGVAPGIGKSTLAKALAGVLSGRSAVDLFGEEELFTRPEFAAVGRGFREKDFPTPAVFLPAFAATFAQQRAASAWGIFDWNCAAMASDLPWAIEDPAALRSFVRDVWQLAADLAPVVLFLDGDVLEATERAAAERGPDWVARWTQVAGGDGSLAAIAGFHRDRRPLHEADLTTLARAGWVVHVLDARRSAGDVLTQALDALGAQA